jgi:hypothetical protein
MALAIRFTGWILFAAGLAVFLLNGSFAQIRNPVNMAALIGTVVGMILTSLSTVIEHFVKLRRPQEPLPPPPPPPLEPRPEKHYEPRPLKTDDKPPSA